MTFEIGQPVRVKADGEEGQVLSFHVDSQGTRYTIASREVDLVAKKIINGVKHCMEDELEEVVEAEDAKEDKPEAQDEQ